MNWAIITSWIFVALLTAGNVFFFLKLKKASDQMIKMAFPNAKSTTDAMAQMQKMMAGLGGRGGMPNMGNMNSPQMQAQMKAAMEMLGKAQNNPKRR